LGDFAVALATSKSVGLLSEVAVLAPIRKGRVPGERRTYEERARTLIATIENRVQQGIPHELDQVTTIHFGEIIVIRPEQYLVYSDVAGVTYEDPPSSEQPVPIDDFYVYVAGAQPPPPVPEFRAFLLTIVFFDGDLHAYFKDIAVFTNTRFDQVFQNCEDYPARGAQDFEGFWNWIKRYQMPVDLYWPRYPNLSAPRIMQLAVFKRRFDDFVARVRPANGPPVKGLDTLFDEFLRENEEYAQDFPSPGGVYERPLR
jgi:hypothetical protein